MAAITISRVSNEIKQIQDPSHKPLAPIEFGARVRVKRFSYTADGDEAVNGIVELLRFNKSVDILFGYVGWDDDFSLATGSVDIGYTNTRTPTDDNIDDLLDGGDTTDVEAGTIIPEDGGVGLHLTDATSVILKVLTAKLTAGKTISGYVLYVENS